MLGKSTLGYILRPSHLPPLHWTYFTSLSPRMERRRHRFSTISSSGSSFQESIWSNPPPRRPVSSWRQDNRWQLVWPNDRRRGIWGRWKDIFTNKGPDIFIAEQNTREPEGPIWSNWKTPGHQHPDDHRPRWVGDGDRPFRQDEELVGVFDWQRRDPGTKYDFATRRYRKPSAGVLSGIDRTRPHRPLQVRDRNAAWVPLDR